MVTLLTHYSSPGAQGWVIPGPAGFSLTRLFDDPLTHFAARAADVWRKEAAISIFFKGLKIAMKRC
ncbi:MAG TPA: hypothetical protein VIW92_01820 [Thermoanaerobaculia bacterium]